MEAGRLDRVTLEPKLEISSERTNFSRQDPFINSFPKQYLIIFWYQLNLLIDCKPPPPICSPTHWYSHSLPFLHLKKVIKHWTEFLPFLWRSVVLSMAFRDYALRHFALVRLVPLRTLELNSWLQNIATSDDNSHGWMDWYSLLNITY